MAYGGCCFRVWMGCQKKKRRRERIWKKKKVEKKMGWRKQKTKIRVRKKKLNKIRGKK